MLHCTRQVRNSLLLTFPYQEDDAGSLLDVVSPLAVGKVMEFLERYQTQLASVDERLATLIATRDKLDDEIKVGLRCTCGCTVCRFHLLCFLF